MPTRAKRVLAQNLFDFVMLRQIVEGRPGSLMARVIQGHNLHYFLLRCNSINLGIIALLAA
eukprot:scaffold109846_cov36-Prasinocladus_malaysianus.AAC.1